jgi:ganglioside GM2 activator
MHEEVLFTVQVDLTVEKKIGFFWITVPCIEHIGSCTIDNVCSATLPCPSVFKKYGIPCQCPIKKV